MNCIQGFQEDSVVCSGCESLASEILKINSEILRLKQRLSSTLSSLLDSAQLGQTRLNDDLTSVGDQSLTVKIIQDPVSSVSDISNITSTAQFRGEMRAGDQDDGSSPAPAQVCDQAPVILITQTEWASAGLNIVQGVVQVPPDLVSGLAISSRDERYHLSRAVSEDFEQKYLCLDCGQGYDQLSSLVDHSQQHLSNNNTAATSVEETSFVSHDQELNVEEESHTKSVVEEPVIKDLNETDQYRIQLRSFMHKEQFKHCINDVPTLDKPFQCEECNMTFERAHDLWGHSGMDNIH